MSRPPSPPATADPAWELDAGRVGASLPCVTLLDTASASTNLGDRIIMEAVHHELAGLLAGRALFTVASHEPLSRHTRRLLRRSEYAIAGGTNLLSSRMWFRSNWKVGPRDALSVGPKVVLMGVGWYQYQHAPDPYSRWLLRRLLSRTRLHAVRESYAIRRLASIGIDNAVNTGCPSIWQLRPEATGELPKRRARNVVTALNSYRNLDDPAADRRLLETLGRRYAAVYLWVQTHTDYAYARDLGCGVRFVEPSVEALDRLLESDLDLDYVGVRLHAGIRALQKGRRAIILEIDNRAREMGRDFGLPTVERGDFERLEAAVEGPLEIAVRPPRAEIDRWKSQFR